MVANKIKALRILTSRQGFFRDVAILAGGTAAAQVLSILVSPLLTRLFTPSDFGLLSIYTSLLSILSVLVSFRYEMALPLAEDETCASNLFVLALSVVLLTCCLVSMILITCGSRFTGIIHVTQLTPYLWTLPLSLMGIGVYQVLNYWSTRKGNFAEITKTKVVQSIGQQVVQVLSGLFTWRPEGLITGYIVSQILGSGSLARRADVAFRHVTLSGIKSAALSYRQFPLFTMWSSLINVLGLQAPSLLFATLFTVDDAGYYSLAMRVLGIPSSVVGQAIAQVFYPVVVKRHKQASFTIWFQKLTITLFLFSVLIFGFLSYEGPVLFTWAFGAKWSQSGIYAEILCPWFVVSFISSPLSIFTFVAEKQKQSFYITIYETVFRIVAIFVGKFFFSFKLSLLLYSLAGSAICLIYILWILWISGAKLSTFSRSICKPFLWTSAIFAGISLLQHIVSNVLAFWVTLVVSIFCAISCFKYVRKNLLTEETA